MAVQNHQVSQHELFRQFRQMPEMRQLVKDCYLDEDVLAAAQRFYRSEEFRSVLEYVGSRQGRRRGRVLDLGCGNGFSSLAWHWAGYDVVAVEPDRSEVVGLQALLPFIRAGRIAVDVCAAVGEQLPFGSGCFDLVYERQVLHHVPDLRLTAREVRRVLCPGGTFIATREHVVDSQADLPHFFERHPTHRYTGIENALRLTEYRTALQEAGFRWIRLIGPWQSPINYHPLQQRDMIERTRRALARRLGERVAACVARRPGVLRLYGRHLGRVDHLPGRMYSFIARA